ncbi:5'-methylthioadenosine/adenosylhomocysteine nucleosidase [Francisellaceae bacterium]|nr:5'-methylthioadenosine/adenosylhomocysteine nucleosidase [Francisellaceae bacterium]
MKILIVAAMHEELDGFVKSLPSAHSQENNIYHFVLNTHLCQALACGIGKVNSAVNVTKYVLSFKPDLVINIGTAAGIGNNTKIFDTIIGSEFIYSDVDAVGFGYAFGQVPQMPAAYPLHSQLANKVKSFTNQNEKVKLGQIVSGDSFINDQKIVEDVKSKLPQALSLDMESVSIAQTCHLLDKPFLCVRGVTDKADDASSNQHVENLEQVSKNVAEATIRFIQSL